MFDARLKKSGLDENDFYKNHYYTILMTLIGLIGFLLFLVLVVLFLVHHRPLPSFAATQPDGRRMQLTSFDKPNLQSETIIRWARRAATLAYTFNLVNYQSQLAAAKPFFTENGWRDYYNSVTNLVNSVVERQLFVNSVVTGKPVISNQGILPGKGYSWRVQVPFLVTYQSGEQTRRYSYYVLLTIVQVPTSINPQGIGIDQFVMVSQL